MQQIAVAGGGIYIRANNSETGLNKLFKEINKMDKQEFEAQVYSEFDHQFQYYIGLTVLLLLLDMLILDRKNKFLKNIHLFNKNFRIKMKNIILLILFALFAKYLFAQKEIKDIREGNKYYNDHKYQKSEISYRKALEKKSDSYKAGFNLGDALYKEGKFEDAANQFKSLINYDLSKDDLAKAYHNLGNSLLESKKYEESVDAYKSALRNNSKDDDTRYNLAYAQKMIRQQQKQKQENKQNDKEQKKDQKNQQNKQQQQKNKNDEKKNKQQQMSKEDADRLLKASQDKENNAKKKQKEAKLIKGEKQNIEKDW